MGDLESNDVQGLLALHVKHMRLSSPTDACHVLPLSGLRDPALTFWSLRESDRLLAVGALKELGPGHGEIKSMRTAPDALRRGAGGAMLEHILKEARHRRYERVSLETGSTAPFGAALKLYARYGFTACDPFSDYRPSPFTVFLTKEL